MSAPAAACPPARAASWRTGCMPYTGIQAGFGVHFQNPCLRVEEDVLGDLSLIHQTGLLQNLLRIELFVEEAVTAHHVAQMKVHHPPRGQNGFLVGVAEVAEDLGNALHTLGGRYFVSSIAMIY